MEQKKLSILICSLKKRAFLLSQLLSKLEKQMHEDVEILVEIDNGEMPIGKKRNLLLEKATGTYIAFVDDDDNIDSQYVQKILTALQENPDCCSLEGIITVDGRNPRKFIHSLRYDHWFETKEGQSITYFRNPNHLNTIRRDIALKVKFPETDWGEDKDFSQRIFPLLKKEAYIPGPIYFYQYSPSTSESGKKKK